ncbi:MAG: hypothetical protein ABI847_14305 [Anaerolineales bacterium]
MTVPVITHGSKIGIHAIYPHQVIPLVKAARDLGAAWPLVKGVDNGGIALDVKQVSPQTLTITRFVNTAEDSAQDVDHWSPADMRTHAQAAISFIADRLNAQERAAADWLEPLNEADPPGVAGWRAFGRYLCEVVHEADRRGVKIALPAFNSGTPEWDEMNAFVESGLFGLMRAGGHILTAHEGMIRGQPVDVGFGDPIPGAPTVPGAGSICFRYRYLYWLLGRRSEEVPLVISEFYAGGNYGLLPEEQLARFAWYDQEARKDQFVLAVLPFTVDPSGAWVHQDYTYAYPAVLEYLVQQKDISNVPPPRLIYVPLIGATTVVPDGQPAPEHLPPADTATHRVIATELNIRLHPYTGELEPPKQGTLPQGARVTVLGVYQPAGLPFGWACLSPNGDRWVSLQWLEPL